MSENNGGLAFPSNYVEQHGKNEGMQFVTGGMTLRDYFAGQALAGELASQSESFLYKVGTDGATSAAKRAFEFADAMIAERDKTAN
jgi:hypothetical protein